MDEETETFLKKLLDKQEFEILKNIIEKKGNFNQNEELKCSK
jgi:hypothetical protein